MADTTGGPAFPVWELNGHGQQELTSSGMTLRDYFAAKAMQGLCSSFANVATTEIRDFLSKMPGAAYEIADAMLKAREAGNG